MPLSASVKETAALELSSVVPTTIIWMSERVELLSNNTIKIKIYEPGKLIPPFEMLDAVNAGKVNACYGVSGYWQGKFPAASFFTAVPFGPEATEYLAWIYYGNGMKLWQEMYDQGGMKVKALLAGVLPRILDEHPHAHFLGAGFLPDYLGEMVETRDRAHFLGTVSYHDYATLVRQCDITLCPVLPDDPFNLGKSALKAIEGMAAGRRLPNGRNGGSVPITSKLYYYQRATGGGKRGLSVEHTPTTVDRQAALGTPV